MHMKKSFDLLHLDPHLLLVSKPSGMLSIPGRGQSAPSLSDLLRKEFPELFVVHRIDRETSGVVLFARNAEAHRMLSMQFQEKKVSKTYYALCAGQLWPEAGEISAPIGENPAKAGSQMVRADGKESLTRYQCTERWRFAGRVLFYPETGRTHQIRVHARHIGHPLLGDELYGQGPVYLSSFKKAYKQTSEDERPVLSRLALHAQSISFVHPSSGVQISVDAPLPPELELMEKLLSKYSR
jgi:23S rRNA pseudouridine1911/1915/1917 synthase